MIEFLLNEEIILEKRKHWFIITIKGLALLLIAVLPLVIITGIIVFESFFALHWIFASIHFSFIIFFIAFWWEFLLIIFFIAWTNYYLDVFIITNKRIIDIEQIRLFVRDVAEVRLEKVQDVKVEIIGMLSSLLNMGNIHIQTAGESREIVIKGIAKPHQIREILAKHHDIAFSKTNNL